MLSTKLHAQTERLHVLFVRCKPPLFYSSTAAFKLHCSPLFLLETKSTIYHFKMVEFSVLYFMDALRIQFYHLKFTKMPMNLKKEKIMFWQKLIRAFYLFIYFLQNLYLSVCCFVVSLIYLFLPWIQTAKSHFCCCNNSFLTRATTFTFRLSL